MTHRPREIALFTFLAGLALGIAAMRVAFDQPLHQDRAQRAGGANPTSWLKSLSDDPLDLIEKHLRGLDVSMVEIGHRYNELQAAVQHRNWRYVQYQAQKIDLSLRLAIERRPARARSAIPFLNESIPPMLAAAEAQNGEQLERALATLQRGCIQCHRAENVLFMGHEFALIQPTRDENAQAIAKFRTLLAEDSLAESDLARGRALYAEHCEKCHRLFGAGGDVGPDLTDLPRSDLNYLLARIVDPNSMIGADYLGHTLLTVDGRTVTGRIVSEDDATLTICTADETLLFSRDEIVERRESTVSMMPEALLDPLTDSQVRDLIGYVQRAEPNVRLPGDR